MTDLTTPYTPSYTLPSFKSQKVVMGNLMFSSALTLMCVVILSLVFIMFNMIESYPPLSALFMSQCINLMGCFTLIGVGIGLPLVMLASFFGWVQLLLLLKGNIPPHLAREGFVKVLNTLSSKI